MDSLTAGVELAHDVEKVFKVKISFDQLFGGSSIREIGETISKLLGKVGPEDVHPVPAPNANAKSIVARSSGQFEPEAHGATFDVSRTPLAARATGR